MKDPINIIIKINSIINYNKTNHSFLFTKRKVKYHTKYLPLI